jgi:sulfur relay (sulfurtransferase) DsrF/TusC family protein
MVTQPHSSLALIVSSKPYEQRVARANIDLALAAAALDFELRVYFSGSSIFQLAAERQTRNAMLPAGYRAWAALPGLAGLAEVLIYVEQRWLDICIARGVELSMPLEALNSSGMKRSWRNCRHVMVI